MTHRDIDGWDGAAEPTHRDIDVRPAGTRRAVLGAAGGLFLAASGLFLPEHLQETEAQGVALGGNRGGRRGKNRRGRHKKRTHGSKTHKPKNDDKGRGGAPTKNIAFTVRNFRSADVQVQGWDMTQSHDAFFIPSGWDWTTLTALPAAGPSQPSTKEFMSNSWQSALRIGTDRFVAVLNHGTAPFMNGELPDVEIGTGGWSSKGWGPRGYLRTESDPLNVGRSIAADGIKITRTDDSPDHLRFTVDLT